MSDDNFCFDCDLAIGSDDACVVCNECLCAYHFGICSGLSEKTYKSKGDAARKQWRCPFCRGAKQKRAIDSVTAASIAQLQEKVKQVQETVTAIEASVQMVSDKYDSVLAKLTENERDIAEVKRRVDRVQAEQGGEAISDVKKDINELEWHNRKLNLEFHGIPKSENEDVLSKVNELATTLKLPQLEINDVTAAHRLPSKPDKTPGVIVRFTRQAVRDNWFEARKKLKTADSDVYIQENLTKQTRKLLWETKQWARESNFQFVWHSNGKVLVRRTEGDKAIVVKSQRSLETIV